MTKGDEPTVVETAHRAVKPARGPRHAGRGTARLARASEAEPIDDRGRNNPVFAVVSALPMLMLLIGLYVFYSGEWKQSAGAPFADESVRLTGVYDGLSKVGGQQFLWLSTAAAGESADRPTDRRQGLRVRPESISALRTALSPGDAVALDAAPNVAGSGTLWLWRLEHAGQTVLDDSDRLR